ATDKTNRTARPIQGRLDPGNSPLMVIVGGPRLRPSIPRFAAYSKCNLAFIPRTPGPGKLAPLFREENNFPSPATGDPAEISESGEIASLPSVNRRRQPGQY